MNLDEQFFEHLSNKGFSERWFYLSSVQNLLLYVVNGFSNETVATMIGLDSQYVRIVCESFLDFSGWEEDLDYSPLFRSKEDLLTNQQERDIMDKYGEYRKELDGYYERDEIA
jgi:hypothetical protein